MMKPIFSCIAFFVFFSFYNILMKLVFSMSTILFVFCISYDFDRRDDDDDDGEESSSPLTKNTI